MVEFPFTNIVNPSYPSRAAQGMVRGLVASHPPPMWYGTYGSPLMHIAAPLDSCWSAWPQTVCQPTPASNLTALSVNWSEKHGIYSVLYVGDLHLCPWIRQSTGKVPNFHIITYPLNNHLHCIKFMFYLWFHLYLVDNFGQRHIAYYSLYIVWFDKLI